jgi:hypothetical protein
MHTRHPQTTLQTRPNRAYKPHVQYKAWKTSIHVVFHKRRNETAAHERGNAITILPPAANSNQFLPLPPNLILEETTVEPPARRPPDLTRGRHHEHTYHTPKNVSININIQSQSIGTIN